MQNGPTLNTYDVPEMMLGAQPSANSVERERFNQRCITLWKEDSRRASEASEVVQHNNAAEHYSQFKSQLQSIFPDLDPELIGNICYDTRNIQEAVDALLAVSTSMSAEAGISAGTDTEVGANASTATVPVDLATQQPTESSKVADPSDGPGAWPALLDNEGWEVVSYRSLQQQEQDLGSAWCKTAKDAAHLPAPKPSRSTASQPKEKHKESNGAMEAMDFTDEDGLPTDYELRQMRGQMRAAKLAIKAVARGANQACNDALNPQEQLAAEPGSSCRTLSELEIQGI